MKRQRGEHLLFSPLFNVVGENMANDYNWDSPEAFLFKECYDLATAFEKLDIAKDVLREKSKRVNIPSNYIPSGEDVYLPETDMKIISDAIFELSLEGFTASGNKEFKNGHRISALPDSSEKEYVLALMALRSGTSESQRLEALRHLMAALDEVPDDPRYLALANILKDVDK